MKPAETNDPPVAELLRDAVSDVRELVKLEVELATDEVRAQLRATLFAAIAFGMAALAVLIALALFAVALVFALGGTAGVAAAVGGGFVALAAVAAAIGYGALPKNPMEETRVRVLSDVALIKEGIA